jgi:nucleoside-diphosphate-sugar epimerase
MIFVDDIVAGLIACAKKGDAGGVYNLASGVETTILELAETINELTGNPTPIALTPARDWDHSGKRYGDPTKAKEALGFSASTELTDGLRQTIAWTEENLAWIERCMVRFADRVPGLKIEPIASR